MAGGGNRGRCRGKTPGARPNRRGRGLGVRLSRRFTSRPARTVPPGAMNYYERLQVDRKASPEVIKSAYRVLLKDIHGHPDLGGDAENTKAINEAYETLGDPRLRGQYDREPALADRCLNPPPPPEYILFCQFCGKRNRIRDEARIGRARCGACHRHR